tara:strand:+ start:619 stop:1194 length:576 start_codon:yes stop_codon:yes gene_type:complete
MYFKRVGLKNICVFCASKDGNNETLRVLAQELGEKIARNGLGLVYGGAQIGLMGLVANATLASAGEVIGVIPETLADREVAHPDITSLIVTRDMHERKKRMYELADGFIALPGGMGTLEEIFEAATWTKLGMHLNSRYKPVVLLDDGKFWKGMTEFLDLQVSEGFVSQDSRDIVASASSVDEAIQLVVKRT